MGIKLIGSTIALVAPTVAFGSLKLVAPANPEQPLFRQRGIRVDLCYWFFAPLVLRVIEKFTAPSGCAILGRGLGGWGPWHNKCVCGFERRGAWAVGGNRGRPQPAAQARQAGRIVLASTDRGSAQQVAHRAAHPPRRLPLDRRSAGRHHCPSRRAQCQPKTLRPAPIRRCHSRQAQPASCDICRTQCTSWTWSPTRTPYCCHARQGPEHAF
jgi:hypothetical protein